ncbi:MAG: hypothetical protein HLX51_06475 [Micrococcaceae bacterium]|nr:hypothetical protein [Micrococcaceae bacterium]
MTTESVTKATTTTAKENMEQQSNITPRNDDHTEETPAPAGTEQPENAQEQAPADEPATEPDAGQESENDDLTAAMSDGDKVKKANREAANYRHQLREAQAEIEQLKAAAETGLQQAFNTRLEKYTTVTVDREQAGKIDGAVGIISRGHPEVRLKHPEDFERMTGLTAQDLTYEGTSQLDETRYAQELAKLLEARPELFEGTEAQHAQYRGAMQLSHAFGNHQERTGSQDNSWQGAFRPAEG